MTLMWYDVAIFAAMLLFSTLIGLYFGCTGKKQSTTDEYLLGNKKMKVVPIGVSISVSHFSGVSMMAMTSSTFRFGTPFFLFMIPNFLVALLSIFVYLPVFFKLQLATAYDYLAKRFDNRTKQLAVYLYVLGEVIYFPVTVFIPSMVFSTVTGYNIIATSFIISCFCIFYTTIGGLRAVVWTDLLQFVIILSSVIVIYFVGLEKSGGFWTVWNAALEGDRLNTFNFNPDPTLRENFWSIVIGNTMILASKQIVHQTGVQKFLSVSKFRKSVWTNIYGAVCTSAVLTFCGLIGLIIYAKYGHCDPLATKKIAKHDQIMPFFVMDVAGDIPGIPGLFLATIFSAALSSMSSMLNSLSCVIYQDIIKRFLKREQSEKTKSNILKIIVAVSGILCTCLVFVVDMLEEIIVYALTFMAASNGPLMGLFTLGMLFPKANAKGAFIGGIGGLVSVGTLTIVARYYQIKGVLQYKYLSKPVTTNGCNGTYVSKNVIKAAKTVTTYQVPAIFNISFHYYALVGAAATIIIGLLVSYITHKKGVKVDKDLISPVCHFLLSKNENQKVSQEMKERNLEEENLLIE